MPKPLRQRKPFTFTPLKSEPLSNVSVEQQLSGVVGMLLDALDTARKLQTDLLLRGVAKSEPLNDDIPF